MRNLASTIPCPCGSSVHVEVDVLLQGGSFICTGCQAEIRMDMESMPVVAKAVSGITGLIETTREGASL